MRTKYVWEKILPVSVGLMLYELAAGSSFYLMELSLVLLAGSFLLEERKIFMQLPKTISTLGQELKRLCWVWIFLGLYLGWEIVTLSYSIYPEGVFDKYKVVFLMICFSILILWYRRKGTSSKFLMDSRRKTLLFVFAVSAMTAAVLSVINISFPVLYPVLYGRRLSLRLDYNLFSQVVLFGLIAGETLIGARQENILCKKRLFLWLVCAPAVVLSSSRRNTIFLLCFFVWTVLYTAVKIKKEEADSLGKHSLKAIVSWKSVLQWAAVLMGVIVLTGLMQIYLDWQYERMEERARLENREMTGISDGSALERYEQIAQGGGESKRKIIWSVAIREYADFSLTEKLTGKGFGYDRLLYQKTDDRELLETYAPESRSFLSAHCFVLADLLNSGLIGAVLGILVWVAIGVRLLKMLLAGEKGTMFFVITLGITFANNLISNRYGFLYDKYFWLLLSML